MLSRHGPQLGMRREAEWSSAMTNDYRLQCQTWITIPAPCDPIQFSQSFWSVK